MIPAKLTPDTALNLVKHITAHAELKFFVYVRAEYVGSCRKENGKEGSPRHIGDIDPVERSGCSCIDDIFAGDSTYKTHAESNAADCQLDKELLFIWCSLRQEPDHACVSYITLAI